MPKLTLMVGPAGSGKTTYAKSLIYDDGDHGAATVYINQDSQGRDHLRLFEEAILFKQDIIVDRMGFNKSQRDRYLLPAKAAGYETEIVVLHQPYKACLERCLARTDHETIKDEKSARSALATFFGKYERVQDSEADKVTRIWPEGDKPSAIICDLDGTLCNVDHRLHFVRPPKNTLVGPDGSMVNVLGCLESLGPDEELPKFKRDWKSFFDNILGDSVNRWCRDLLQSMAEEHIIVYCSGRPDDRRRDTVQWLKENDLYDLSHPTWFGPSKSDFHLYMRPRCDSRQDNIVKEIILDFEILSRFTPYFMIDDRQQVVDMYRSRGYTVLQCARGDF